MQFSTAFLTALLSATALAAPSPAADVKSMAAGSWTIESMKRTCDKADTACNWSFTVNNGSGKTACAYTVKKSGSTPASHSPQTGVKCGAYTVTSGWSGQFGPGNGFTTLSVADFAKKRIAWPAYTDKQLASGKVVTPNQSFPVQVLA